jgi:hypothetical protein
MSSSCAWTELSVLRAAGWDQKWSPAPSLTFCSVHVLHRLAKTVECEVIEQLCLSYWWYRMSKPSLPNLVDLQLSVGCYG